MALCDDRGYLSAKHRLIGHSWGIKLDNNLTQSVDGEFQQDWAGIKQKPAVWCIWKCEWRICAGIKTKGFCLCGSELTQSESPVRPAVRRLWPHTRTHTHTHTRQPPVRRGLSFATRCSRYGRCTACDGKSTEQPNTLTHHCCSYTCGYTEELCRYLNATLKAANSSG